MPAGALRFGVIADGAQHVVVRQADRSLSAAEFGADGRFGAPVAFGTWPYGAPELGDVDGDGMADLIGRDGAAVVTARATGTGFAAPVGLAQLPRNYSALRSGTLDGSGHLGLVGLDPESGRLRILDAPGTEDADTFAAGRWAKGFSFMLADVDGDGRDDAVGVDRRGRVRVGINEDSAFVVRHVWRIPARAAAAVADVTGDGHADLVYAKDHLAELCSGQGWPYRPWSSFADIQAEIVALLEGGVPANRPRPFICGPEAWPAGATEPIWRTRPSVRSSVPDR
jgi:hypothetical protein